MKQKKIQGDFSLPMLVFVVVILVGIAAYVSTKKPAQAPGAYSTVADLDQASAQLDAVDVDGLGNEFTQIDADSSSF